MHNAIVFVGYVCTIRREVADRARTTFFVSFEKTEGGKDELFSWRILGASL